MTNKNSNRQDLQANLRVQYQQGLENYRMEDRYLWQVPSITIAIISAIVVVAFNYLGKNDVASSALIFFGIILSFAMFITVRKYRFFQHHMVNRLREIEQDLNLRPLPLVTGQDGMTPQNWVERRRAGNWLANILLVLCFCLCGLFIFSLLKTYCHPAYAALIVPASVLGILGYQTSRGRAEGSKLKHLKTKKGK